MPKLPASPYFSNTYRYQHNSPPISTPVSTRYINIIITEIVKYATLYYMTRVFHKSGCHAQDKQNAETKQQGNING